MAGSELGRDQALISLRSAVICLIAFQLAVVTGVLRYLVDPNPAMAILTGGAAFVGALIPLDAAIG